MNAGRHEMSEEMLAAYADGELDDLARRRVEQAVAADPALAERLAQHVVLRDRLSGHYAPLAEAAVPDRFAALLSGDGAAESTVVDFAAARAKRRPALRDWTWGGALAASLVIGLMLGRGLPGGAPVGVAGGRMVAQGALAHALDAQLASAQGADAPYRIGLSFRAKDGNWCRSFDGGAMGGVACRRDGRWALEQAVSGSGAGAGYRQASSGDPRVMATVDALIAGDAADAQAEKRARDSGWK